MHLRLRDALGREIVLGRPPERIVSLVPSHTETLFALGAGGRVVGVTRYCVVPDREVAGLPKVGGTKRVKVDRVLSLRPDLVVANQEENRREDVALLAERGIPIYVTHPRTVEGGIDTIESLGRILGAESSAASLVSALRATLEEAVRSRPGIARRVFVPIWRDPWMTVGHDTYIHDLLSMAGGESVFAETSRYPEITLDEAATRGPEVVLLPDEPFAFGEKDRAELARGLFAALGEAKIHLVDGQLLSWYGPRIGLALETFRRILNSTPLPAPRTGDCSH